MNPSGHDSHNHGHHFILPTRTALTVGGILLFLTIVTVWSAGIDLGRWNVPLAMAIATTKALLVCAYFMNLKHDARENSFIFGTSFLFLAIFVVLTGSDLFFRGNVYKEGKYAAQLAEFKPKAGGGGKFKKPWVESPEVLTHGKAVYANNCTGCHGDAGLGNGIASGGMNPAPRNFTQDSGWKNGRKLTQVFKTLKQGIAGGSMASYESSLSAEDRWAVAHYVRSLGPKAPTDSPADFTAMGVDVNKEAVQEAVAQTISIDRALELMAEKDVGANRGALLVREGIAEAIADGKSAGAQLYGAYCLQCHGEKGEGAVIRNLGYLPTAPAHAVLETARLGSYSSVGSSEQFARVVVKGLPGTVMPGQGQLSTAQVRDLYDYVRSLPGGR